MQIVSFLLLITPWYFEDTNEDVLSENKILVVTSQIPSTDQHMFITLKQLK